MNHATLTLTTLAALTAAATAQSFNIDWGSHDSAPSPAYAAQGLAGTWNTIDSMPNFLRVPLVGLDGNPITPDIMNIGFDFIESFDIPSTTGDDSALLDDCITSLNSPLDGCLFIRFVEPGDYQVIMYGFTPDDPANLSALRIDQNTENPEDVGGTWSGTHQNGITYMTQIATVGADGRLDIHSGLPGANIRSVLNGLQVIALADLCTPDLNNDGQLDFVDISAFLTAFANQDPIADFTGDGSFDFFDISAFLTAFSTGCP